MGEFDPLPGMWRTKPLAPSRPTPKPAVHPEVARQKYLISKRLVRGFLLVVLCLAALVAVGGIGYGLGRGGCTPLPVPTPEPHPTPVDGKIWVVLVKNTNAPGQDFAQLEADPSLGEGINALGGHLLIWGSDSPRLEERGLKSHFDQVGAPALLIEAEGHKSVVAEKLPIHAADVVARVKKFKQEGK